MIPDALTKPVLIFGCGNIMFGDDGFGPAVIDYLRRSYAIPEHVLALDVGTGIRDILFDLLLSEKKPQRLIIVDAVDYPDRRPGEIFEIDVEGIPAQKTSDFSLHQFPTVNLLKELRDHTSIDLTILVAQVADLPEEVCPGLSPAMQEAVVQACERLGEALK